MTVRDVAADTGDQQGWLISSYSNDGGSCVEVRLGPDVVLVRDSKDRRPDRPVMGVSGPGWTSFLDTIRR